jgi:hypothetical protein
VPGRGEGSKDLGGPWGGATTSRLCNAEGNAVLGAGVKHVSGRGGQLGQGAGAGRRGRCTIWGVSEISESVTQHSVSIFAS